MTTAREIIARHLCTMTAQGWSAISPFERAAYRTTAAGMVEAVTAAGYRILGPGELDVETVERCAEVAEKTHYMHSSHQYYRSAAINIAAAIRALTAKD